MDGSLLGYVYHLIDLQGFYINVRRDCFQVLGSGATRAIVLTRTRGLFVLTKSSNVAKNRSSNAKSVVVDIS